MKANVTMWSILTNYAFSSRSPAIAAETKGTFLEGKSQIITIAAPSASVNAINRMLDYIYLQSYNDSDDDLSKQPTPLRELSKIQSEKVIEDENAIELATEAEFLRIDHTQYVQAESITLLVQGTEDTECFSSPNKCVPLAIQRIINNVHLYALADYYQIRDLKHAAIAQVSKRLDDNVTDTFADVISEVSRSRIIMSEVTRAGFDVLSMQMQAISSL